VALFKLSTKGSKGIQVEIDRAIANAAAPKVWNEGFAELVQERTTKKNRNATGASVGINFCEVSALDSTGVKL
jgi:hypothetical protein